jgi:uncharacterized radical SAM protein YgiQ
MNFLPTTRNEIHARGWDAPDVILVTGDAYVDHPSFGVAVIGRWLEAGGYRVAILAQPDWRSVEPFRVLGRPRLFWGITSGCLDSRLNDYASMGGKRRQDVYSPGGQTGLRPAKPLLTYAARAREAFPEVPIVLGGVEASLRRLVHFDYIEDRLKRSVLIDAKADLLVYGMGERAIINVARALEGGRAITDVTEIHGTAFPANRGRCAPEGARQLPSLTRFQENPFTFLQTHTHYQKMQYRVPAPVVFQEQDPGTVVVNPPAEPLGELEMDQLYALPYTHRAHPRYEAHGGIPALEPVQFSIVTHRGCFGGCSFCAIGCHQGKVISSRSSDSVLEEAERFRHHPDFKGTIVDVGGPSANMFRMGCKRAKICIRTSCVYPDICPDVDLDHGPLMSLMETLLRWAEPDRGRRRVKLFVASGIRHDMALNDRDYLNLLTRHFVGGHLKVAPEHTCPHVLDLMGKPRFEVFEAFEDRFREASRRAGKEQYLVPYFISAHPGCRPEDAVTLTEYLVSRNWRPRQVQDFVPAPSTLATAMFVSERDDQGHRIHVPKSRREKRLQAALMQYFLPQNQKPIQEFLKQNGQQGLAGRISRQVRGKHRK